MHQYRDKEGGWIRKMEPNILLLARNTFNSQGKQAHSQRFEDNFLSKEFPHKG